MAFIDVGNVLRIPTSSAYPNCSVFRVSRPEFGRFLDGCFVARSQRQGLISLDMCKLRRRFFYVQVRATSKSFFSKTSLVSENPRFSLGFDLGKIQGRYCQPRATAGIDYGLIDEWDKTIQIGKEFVTGFLKTLELRRKLVRRAIVVGTVILAGVLAWKHPGGFAVCLGVGATILLLGLLDHGKFRLAEVKASRTQLRAFTEAMFDVSQDLQKVIVSSFSPSSKSNVGNSSFRDQADDCKPDVELVVTNIATSVAQLMSILNSDEVAGDIKSLNGVMSGIEYLRQDLKSVETAVIAKRSHFHPKPNSVIGVEQLVQREDAPPATPRAPQIQSGNSEVVKTSTVSQLGAVESDQANVQSLLDSADFGDCRHETHKLFSVNLVADEESLTDRTLQVHATSVEPDLAPETGFSKKEHTYLVPNEMAVGEGYSSDIFLEENLVVPFVSSKESQTEDLLPDALTVVPENPATIDTIDIESRVQNSNAGVDDLVEVREILSVNSPLVEEHTLCNQSKDNNNDSPVLGVRRIRSKSPDPWRTNSTGSFELEVLASDCCGNSSNGKWGANDDGNLLDLVLVGQNSKPSRQDGIGNGRGINANSSVDFWGKNVGRISKNEQRGTLTKRKATGRGSFGSVDDLDDERPQEWRNRSDEDNRQVLKDVPSRSGQVRDEQQPPGPGRDFVNDNGESRWNKPSRGDYVDGKAESRYPQNVQPDRELDMRSIASDIGRERKADDGDTIDYPGSIGRRFSSQTEVRPSSSSLKSRGIQGRSSQAPDESFRAGSRDVNVENREPRRMQDVPQNSDGGFDRGPQVGAQGGRRSYDSSYALSESEMKERILTLQQSKQSQSRKFEMFIDEGQALLNEAMQGLEGRIEVGVAERMLDKATKIFEKALEMNPTNLTTVGLLGNTMLVHGQLKLRLSQQLREMLPSPMASFSSPNGGPISEKERRSLEATLQDVCEECEELLVDAGRMYRRALSLERSDVRALYNWGLALCYRGQLIADEDGERAVQDADKLFMAAIDKYEAMMGISQEYRPGGLVNWGLALIDRSRLRAMGDKERVKLVQQAKGLFLEAVRLDANYGQARGALAVCTAELEELEDFAAQQRDNRDKPAGNWW